MRYREPFTLLKRGKIWYYRLAADPRRIQHSTGKQLKGDAKDYVEALFRKVGEIPIFAEFAGSMFNWKNSNYLNRRREQARGKQISETVAGYRHAHVQNYLTPAFGNRRLNEIGLEEFENWLYGLVLSNQTKCHILCTANLIFKEAVRLGKLKINPLAGIEAPSPSNRARDVLQKEELEKLFPRDMAAFLHIWPESRYGVMFALAVSGGLRSGELRALRWKHIAWDRGGVVIMRAVKPNDEEGAPKHNSVRGVLVPDRMMELLRWWYTQCVNSGPEELVFPRRDRNTLVWAFRQGMKRAGIDYSNRYLDVHALRHTYNTYMRDLIEDAKLMALTGHKSLKMVDNYDHREIEGRLDRLAPLRDQINKFPL